MVLVVEQESREETGAARSQHVVHIVPRDATQAARLLSGPLGRSGTAGSALTALLVTPSADDSAALGEALAAEPNAHGIHPLVLTSPVRASRLLSGAPRAVIGHAALLQRLLAESRLDLSSVQLLALVWTEDLVEPDTRERLEALLADIPREAQRTAVVSRAGGAVDEFLDRAMWRARRVTHVPEGAAATAAIGFAIAAHGQRASVLRAALDALDPASTYVAAFAREGAAEARRAVLALGYAGDDSVLRVGHGLPDEPVDLLVLFDEPPDRDTLQRATTLGREVLAMVAPSRLASFRALAGDAAQPRTLSETFTTARTAEDALRSELRALMQRGAHLPHVLALESIVAEFDPVEVAAAAVELLRRERAGRASASAPRVAPSRTGGMPTGVPGSAKPAMEAPAGAQTRLYLSIGERDGVRRGDLVGAITGEAGITGAQIGRIELRDSHAIVEVAAEVASQVIDRLSGVSIRGRRVMVREDREGARRRPSGRGAARGGPRRDAPPRRDARGPRRDARGRGAPRGRDGGTDRLPRAARESEEWSERAERLRRSRRGRPDGEPRDEPPGGQS